MPRRLAAALIALTMVSISPAAEWRDYGGTPDQSKYVVTKDVTKRNVAKLEVAWIYPTGDERAYQFNPIIVDDTMYVLAKGRSIVALDAATGRELWTHANEGPVGTRGMNYWRSPDGSDEQVWSGVAAGSQYNAGYTWVTSTIEDRDQTLRDFAKSRNRAMNWTMEASSEDEIDAHEARRVEATAANGNTVNAEYVLVDHRLFMFWVELPA